MARRKQARPRPFYLAADGGESTASDGDDSSSCSRGDGPSSPDAGQPEDEMDHVPLGGRGDIDAMPPTDGDVIAAASAGDSSAASAANSSLSVPFSCGYCQRSFPRLSLLKKHEQAHSDEMPFRCDYCLRMFKHKRSRDRHVKLHTGDKKYRCQHCEAAFSRSDHLKIHIKTHDTRKPFQCSVCQRGYSTAAALTSHMLNHRRESGSRCGSLCSSTSSSSSSSGAPASSSASTPCPSLPSPVSPPPTPTADGPTIIGQQQQQQQQQQQPPPSAVTPPMDLPNSPASPPQQYQESRSGKSPDRPAAAAAAAQPSVTDPATSHRQVKPDAGKVETDSKRAPIALQCPYCTHDSFPSLAALSLHVQSLHGPLGEAETLRQQQATLAGLLYACQLCSLRFGNLPALQQHTLSAHSLADVLRLYCPPSGAQTTPAAGEAPAVERPTDLSCPRKRCPADARRRCPHCPAEFELSETEALQSHVAGHLMSACSEYGCSSCAKRYATPDELQRHLFDVHAQHVYRCSLCHETFDSKVAIQVHLAVEHSSESKVFRCSECSSTGDAIYRHEAEFRAHVAAVHVPPMEQQPAFKCPACPQSFPVELLLERHVHLNHQTDNESPVVDRLETDKLEGASSALNLSLHCAYCGESCKSRADLESHMKTAHSPAANHQSSTVTSGGKIKCNICDEVFASASVLAEHKLSHCKVSGAAVCATCRVPLPSEEAYYAHMQTPPHGPGASPPLACLVCRQTLSLPVEIGLHARFHAQSANEPALFPCCICQRHLASASLIANGMAHNGQQTYVCKDCLHAHNQLAMIQQQQQQQPGSVLFPPRSYQCIKCQEIFASEAEIQSHVLATHLLSSPADVHPCRLCGRQFDAPLKLQAHLIEHTFAGCPAFACYLCGCLFTAATSLQRHVFEQHGGALGVRPYDCSRCHLQFFFRAELENHLLAHAEADAQLRPLVHSFARDSSAPDRAAAAAVEFERRANETTTEESEATRDEDDMDEDDNISVTSSSHASEITLSDAQKAANAVPDEISEERKDSSDMSDSSSDLSTSSATRKPDASSGPFRCDRCDQSFPCLSNLQGHVRIHTQSRRFTCPEPSCGKEFALRRNLHIHMRSHTGDRPYSCPMCPKRFARKENRKAHLKLHSGVKPFRCAVCSKTFARKSHLAEHGRTHAASAPQHPDGLDRPVAV